VPLDELVPPAVSAVADFFAECRRCTTAFQQAPLPQLCAATVALLADVLRERCNAAVSPEDILLFVKRYEIDVEDLTVPLLLADGGVSPQYACFNDVLLRSIAPGTRVVSESASESVVVAPGDCRVALFPSLRGSDGLLFLNGAWMCLNDLLPRDVPLGTFDMFEKVRCS
jgi:phosphatidylserine decarboxylase